MSAKHSTRESWLQQAGGAILTGIILPNVTSSNVVADKGWQVACGWPSARAVSHTRKRIGECWATDACSDGKTHHLFISPALDKPLEVLETLTHELVHAVVGPEEKHKGLFRKVAVAIGLEGKMTATHAGEELVAQLTVIAKTLGAYPHASLNYTKHHKPQSTRLIKLAAPVSCCGFVVRTTRVWLANEGLPLCPHGRKMREAT